jgi:hypothetical protein
MSKAAESELNDLHAVVAKVLKDRLTEEVTLVDEHGVESRISAATPADINAAIKFLKDNEVTATLDADKNVKSISELLEEKREKREEKRSNALRLASVAAE